MPSDSLTVEVCIAGGGPAGVMLGVLLARAGVRVAVLEKHTDFFRDFRGDTVHPSTIDLIDQLGIRGAFERIPHSHITTLDAVINGIRLHPLDFRSLRGRNREIALMPQWDLLDLLATEGRRHAGFRLIMGAEVTDVVQAAGRVSGVIATTPDGELRVDATLTVAADGRDSTVRRALALPAAEFGVPIDVLWFRLPRPAAPMPDTLLHADETSFVITIPRPDYLQCGLLIPKGSFESLRAEGLEAFRARIAGTAHRLAGVVSALDDWEKVKLLSVQVDRLEQWWLPGALCIGDAAHAMSPAFGVGINDAVQDAVAAANALVPVLRSGSAPTTKAPDPAAIDGALAAVQRRRTRPTAMMQRIQLVLHRFIANDRGVHLLHDPPTRPERMVLRVILPLTRRFGARLIGYGFRPERIDV